MSDKSSDATTHDSPVGHRKSVADPVMHYSCVSHTGRRRAHNEDNILFLGKHLCQDHGSFKRTVSMRVHQGTTACVAVFDGMGGEQAGEVASFAAALTLSRLYPSLEVSEESVLSAFLRMQKAVINTRDSIREYSMGTTATLLVSDGIQAIVGNIGDSPSFLLRNDELISLSVAHTDEQMLRDLGIKRKPALTQYLGVDDSEIPIEPHIERIAIRPGDRILLASDGLTDMVARDDIAAVMARSKRASEIVGHLCVKALEAGGADNVSIVSCIFDGPIAPTGVEDS